MIRRAAIAAAVGGVTAAAGATSGDPVAGKPLFQSLGCTGCHTLAAASATGGVGPNLDQSKPAFDLVVARVTGGRGVMPSFSPRLTDQQIADVAAFVVQATGGILPASPPPAPPGQPAPSAPAPSPRVTSALPTSVLVRPGPRGLRLSTRRVARGLVSLRLTNPGRRPLQVSFAVRQRPGAPAIPFRVVRLRSKASGTVIMRLHAGAAGVLCRVQPGKRRLCADFRATVPALTTAPVTTTATVAAPPSPGATPTPAPAPVLNGPTLFVANCGSCHTLADAGTTGSRGPNLDDLAPSQSDVRGQVRSGGGGMPSFRDAFTDDQITLIAEYVARVTGG